MTSVSSLRAQFDPDGDNASKQQTARAAALRGAQLAFPKPSRSPAPHDLPPTQSQSDARSAASLVAGRQVAAARPTVPVKPAQISNASLGAVRAHQKSQEALHLDTQRWSFPVDSAAGRGHGSSDSASNVAAALAAARYSPQISHPPRSSHSPYHTVPRSHLARADTEQLAEEDQIPAQGTVNDVKQWLQALDEEGTSVKAAQASSSMSATTHARKSSRPILGVSTTFEDDPRPSLDDRPPPEPVREVKIVSPRPIRAISVTESLEAKTRRAQEVLPAGPSPPVMLKKAISPASRDDETPPSAYFDAEEAPSLPLRPLHPARTSSRRAADQSSHGTEIAKQKPEPPVPRRSRPPVKTLPELDRPSSPRRPVTSHEEKPALPPRLRSGSSSPEPSNEHLKSLPMPVQVPKRGDLPTRPISSTASSVGPRLARKITPHMTGDSLANAIVAGSLASSRAPSPTKSPGPGFHNRAMDKGRLSLTLLGKDADVRTPSPAKSMRHTMRKPASSSDEDERSPHKRSRKFLIRKHPHKHNEGDRKRWRDELTALERKRYEGLWAANRGFYVDASAPEAADSVSNIVVRDIWRRSRLPDHVLEEVWELVDTELAGRLGRAEFVVGLWLIDQRLKGRKLPVKVQPTIWRSARGIHGLKVRNVR